MAVNSAVRMARNDFVIWLLEFAGKYSDPMGWGLGLAIYNASCFVYLPILKNMLDFIADEIAAPTFEIVAVLSYAFDTDNAQDVWFFK